MGLNDGAQVRLVPGEGRVVPYATLSYCWGESNVCTTKETLAEHRVRLRVETLPASIQDAIEYTRRIGIPYLWVDALFM